MSKGRMADALRFSYRGVEIIKNCKKVSGVDDPFDELKFLGQEDLTMLESLYKRIFSVYNLLSESHDGKFIEDAFHALGKLLNELKLRGKSIKLYNDLKALLIQRLRYEKNYTDDEIGKILLTGKC